MTNEETENPIHRHAAIAYCCAENRDNHDWDNLSGKEKEFWIRRSLRAVINKGSPRANYS